MQRPLLHSMTFHVNCDHVSLGFQPESEHYATEMKTLDYMLASNVKHVMDNEARWRPSLQLPLFWKQAAEVRFNPNEFPTRLSRERRQEWDSAAS